MFSVACQAASHASHTSPRIKTHVSLSALDSLRFERGSSSKGGAPRLISVRFFSFFFFFSRTSQPNRHLLSAAAPCLPKPLSPLIHSFLLVFFLSFHPFHSFPRESAVCFYIKTRRRLSVRFHRFYFYFFLSPFFFFKKNQKKKKTHPGTSSCPLHARSLTRIPNREYRPRMQTRTSLFLCSLCDVCV